MVDIATFQLAGHRRDNETAEDQHQRVYDSRETCSPHDQLLALALCLSSPKPPVGPAEYQGLFCDLPRANEVAGKLETVGRTGYEYAAYRELARQTEALLTAITTVLGTEVTYVGVPEPYLSAIAQADDVRQNNRITISDFGHHPQYAHPWLSGDEYNQFRAVHDLFGHVAIGTGFDRHGEFASWVFQWHQYSGLARGALATELHAENSSLVTHGRPPVHRGVLLPMDYWNPPSTACGYLYGADSCEIR